VFHTRIFPQLYAYLHHARTLRALAQTRVFRAPSPGRKPRGSVFGPRRWFLDHRRPLIYYWSKNAFWTDASAARSALPFLHGKLQPYT
jgi:hypothetical protein